MSNPHPLNQTGIFTITTGAAGAPTVRAVLTVPAGTSIVNGTGDLSQAVNPPPHAPTAFTGVVHATGLGSTQQLFSLQGHAIPPRLGATYISQLAIALDGIWASKGTASFMVYNDTPNPMVVTNALVSVEWLAQ